MTVSPHNGGTVPTGTVTISGTTCRIVSFCRQRFVHLVVRADFCKRLLPSRRHLRWQTRNFKGSASGGMSTLIIVKDYPPHHNVIRGADLVRPSLGFLGLQDAAPKNTRQVTERKDTICDVESRIIFQKKRAESTRVRKPKKRSTSFPPRRRVGRGRVISGIKGVMVELSTAAVVVSPGTSGVRYCNQPPATRCHSADRDQWA